jgi:hypothetical protein
MVLPSLGPEPRIYLLRLRNKDVTKELDSCGAHIKQLTALSNQAAEVYKEMKEGDTTYTKEELRQIHATYMQHYKELSFYLDIRKPMLRETSHVRHILREHDQALEDQVCGQARRRKSCSFTAPPDAPICTPSLLTPGSALRRGGAPPKVPQPYAKL